MFPAILLSLVLSSPQVFSFDPHEGGGGNVCISKKNQRLVMMDEFREQFVFNYTMAPESLSLHESVSSAYLQTDLTKLKASAEVAKRLVYIRDPDLSVALYRVLQSLSSVYVTDSRWEDGIGVDPRAIRYCVPNTIRAAFISQYGAHFISRADWNLLAGRSQRILIAHEMVRNLQILIGKTEISDTEVNRWSYLLGYSWSSRENHFLTQEIRVRLSQVRHEVPRAKFREEMMRLEDEMLSAIDKGQIDAAYDILKKIQLVDLAHSAGRKYEPLYSNAAYVQFFEAYFENRLRRELRILSY